MDYFFPVFYDIAAEAYTFREFKKYFFICSHIFLP